MFLYTNQNSFCSPCIIVMDSLKNYNRYKKVLEIISDYLSMEYTAKVDNQKKLVSSFFKPIYAEVPQQQNTTDCGLYLLQCVENFITVWSSAPY